MGRILIFIWSLVFSCILETKKGEVYKENKHVFSMQCKIICSELWQINNKQAAVCVCVSGSCYGACLSFKDKPCYVNPG